MRKPLTGLRVLLLSTCSPVALMLGADYCLPALERARIAERDTWHAEVEALVAEESDESKAQRAEEKAMLLGPDRAAD